MCLLAVCRGLWKAVCWVVDVHGEWVTLRVAAMHNVQNTEHGRYGPSCLYAETVESMNSVGSVCI